MVGHLDGHEENTNPANLVPTCRSCNARCAITLKGARLGRRCKQFNTAKGAETLSQWLAAVMSMKGQSDQMSFPDAVAMIQATPAGDRSQFAKEIWALRRAHGKDTKYGF